MSVDNGSPPGPSVFGLHPSSRLTPARANSGGGAATSPRAPRTPGLQTQGSRGSEGDRERWASGGEDRGESLRESRASSAESAPVSNPSAPAHPSWRPEPRQRSQSGPAPPRAPATSAQPGRETPLGFRWASRAKRWREGGGRSGAWTPTRAEPAGEAERAWEPGARVAGPPPATAECPRCLPAGLLRKALSPRQSLCRRLPAGRQYNPPSRSPPRSPERRQRCSPVLCDADAGPAPGRQRWDRCKRQGSLTRL